MPLEIGTDCEIDSACPRELIVKIDSACPWRQGLIVKLTVHALGDRD